MIAGFFAGLALGPAGFGQISPTAYQKWFPNANAIQVQKDQLATNLQQLKNQLATTGVSNEALSKVTLEFAPQRKKIAQQTQNIHAAMGRLIATFFLFLLLTIVNIIVSKHESLTLASTAVLAILLTLILAQPSLLTNLSWPFAGGLTIFAAIIGLMPLVGSQPTSTAHDSKPTNES